ncbi:MAG: methyl-accepting chemotaxis protein, partial [Pseudomonadota bacterium]
MLDKIRLSVKIPLFIASAATLMAVALGISSYLTASQSVTALTNEHLRSAAEISTSRFTNYLDTIEKELVSVAGNPSTAAAVTEFADSWSVWKMFGGDPKQALQDAYIRDNPYDFGEKHLLDRAPQDQHYHKVHGNFHPWFRDLQQSSGYYDVFLFDTEGNLVYSVFKESDFATNFAENGGEWWKTDLGVVYRGAMELTDPKEFVFEDFESYGPSANAPASFVAAPIFDASGKKVGVLAFQMPVSRINETFKQDAGLGETGEIFLLGSDGKLRNDSKFTEGTDDVLNTQVDPAIVDQAFSADQTTGTYTFYRGEPMSYVTNKFSHKGFDFAVVAMKSEAAALAPATTIRNSMIMIGFGLLIVLGFLGWLAGRSITKPVSGLVQDMTKLSSGDTDVELSGKNRADELGDMSRAVVVFRDGMIEREKLEQKSLAAQQAEQDRQKRIDDLIEAFQESVNKGLETVSQNADTMTNTAGILTSIADGTREKADSASQASDAASDNVQTVASAAEELSSSISEISRQVEEATGVVTGATEQSNATNARVATLAEAANKIGDVVLLISEIAEQTNLLALNATIEAARAGDAGKGFAVVASEVKALANQTAKATDEISNQIKAIQGSTQETVSSIDAIAKTMGDVDNYMSAIAAAVQQQGLATGEISQSVNQAAVGTET